MELRQLRYFCAVAEAGSLSGAAKNIHIAQPALTRQIKLLEQELEFALFIRRANGVQFTVAGEAFYNDISMMLSQLDVSARKAKLLAKGMQGELHLGVTVMMLWQETVSEMLRQFRSHYQHVMLHVTTLLSGGQVNAIKQGHLDAGVVMFAPQDESLESLQIYQDTLVLVVPDNSTLLALGPRKLADIGDYDFVWFDRNNSPAYHEHLFRFFRSRGFNPYVVEQGSDAVTALSLVASGVGCTIVPRSVLRTMPTGLNVIELEDLTLPLDISLVWRKDSICAPLQRLIEIARDTIAQSH